MASSSPQSFTANGRVEAAPPNPLEWQQLRLFTKQDKLNMAFTDATFSFTDGLLDEVAKEVKWQASGPAADDLYTNRQRDREDLGAEYLRACSRAFSRQTGSVPRISWPI